MSVFTGKSMLFECTQRAIKRLSPKGNATSSRFLLSVADAFEKDRGIGVSRSFPNEE